ncbi:MAG: hypothetical protein BGN87_18130 [Rhizobiales bacterium 65-79]|jgi:hypothetical protein|nr:hypothetical protein [Hyphomicrobiales bacterium]OJU03523.1 MAG: hypothetical protein BGN87_18130 [Rhizobiales bacterium 65-79]
MPGTELDHRALAAALESRILDGAGKTPPALRRKSFERAGGGPPINQPYDDLARQIGQSASHVTDDQLGRVVQAAGSEKAAFEIVLTAAAGAGLLRFRSAMKALEEATDASGRD